MGIEKNSISTIIKNNIVLFVGLFVSLPFWWIAARVFAWLVLDRILGYNAAYKHDDVVGSILFGLLIAVYLYFVVTTYQRSEIRIRDEELIVKALGGWSMVDKVIPLKDLESVHLCRFVEFNLRNGSKIRLKTAYIVFESRSFTKFLENLSQRGVKILHA